MPCYMEGGCASVRIYGVTAILKHITPSSVIDTFKTPEELDYSSIVVWLFPIALSENCSHDAEPQIWSDN